jgi:hypothetical protein
MLSVLNLNDIIIIIIIIITRSLNPLVITKSHQKIGNLVARIFGGAKCETNRFQLDTASFNVVCILDLINHR